MSIDYRSIPQCEQAKAFMHDMASGKARGGLGYVVPLINHEVEVPSYTRADFYDSDEKLLEWSLAHLARREWGHDHGVPLIMPLGCGTGVLATAFGACYDPARNWTRPLTTSPEEIESIPLDATLDDGLIPKALETVEHFARMTGGEIPLQVSNGVGGPMDIATIAMNDQDFLLATSLYPEAAHRLLNVCTDLFIGFVKAQQEIAPAFTPQGVVGDMYWPDGMGVMCGEDWLSVIGPKTALEFEIPYINRISDAFGGVLIHACGRLEINFETLKNHVRNLRGINFNAGWSSFPKAVETFRGTDVVLIPHFGLDKHYPFESPLDAVEQVLAAKTPDVTVFLQAPRRAPSYGEDPNGMSEEILRVLERYETQEIVPQADRN